MNQHTAGPWKVEKEEVEYSPEGMYLKGLVVCTDDTAIAHLIEWQAPLEAEANARLMAAAPELKNRLDELLGILAVYADGWHNNQAEYGDILDSMDNARKAIAQATGEQVPR
jgi:hypothetical protein